MNKIEVINKYDVSPIYYVYLHRRLDTNAVFYIGKGKNRRAWSRKSRNNYWRNIVDRHGYSIEILKDNLTEIEAFNLEANQIELYGLDTLSNMTLGGVSTTGYRHTEDTKNLLKSIVKERLDSNPKLKEELTDRITSIVLAPDHYERLAKLNRTRLANMSEDERRAAINKQCAWLQDPVKVANAARKRSESFTDETREVLSTSAKNFWKSMTDDERKTFSKNNYQKLRESENYSNILEAVSCKIVVNGKYLFESQVAFTAYTNTSAAIYHVNSTYPFRAFAGYIIEDYDEKLHTSVTTDYSSMSRLYTSSGLNKCIRRSDGIVFYSLKQAAESIDGSSNSTPDWISKCASNNKPAFGYNWYLMSEQEVSDHILRIIRNDEV